jgi:hypothetical protein
LPSFESPYASMIFRVSISSTPARYGSLFIHRLPVTLRPASRQHLVTYSLGALATHCYLPEILDAPVLLTTCDLKSYRSCSHHPSPSRPFTTRSFTMSRPFSSPADEHDWFGSPIGLLFTCPVPVFFSVPASRAAHCPAESPSRLPRSALV